MAIEGVTPAAATGTEGQTTPPAATPTPAPTATPTTGTPPPQPSATPSPTPDPVPAADYSALSFPPEFKLDKDAHAAATALFAEAKLPAEKAQQLVDLHTKMQAAALAAVTDDYKRQGEEWERQAKADPELGGQRWATTLSEAARGIDRINPKVREVLVDAGVANHPELIRAFAAVGRLFKEDSLVTAGNGATPRGALAMYPNTPGMNP